MRVLRRTNTYEPTLRAARVFMLGGVMTLSFAVIIARLFFIQIISHESYQDAADAQHLTRIDVTAQRGAIMARDHTNNAEGELYPLAINKTFYEIYLNPDEITRPINVAQTLTDTLGVDYDTMLQRAQKVGDVYEPVSQGATEEQRGQLEQSGLTGIHWRERVLRFYPDKNIGSHIIGFYGVQGHERKGAYGIEGHWESTLAGTSRELVIARDRKGSIIPESSAYFTGEKEGSSIVLTIDRTIQYEVCKRLTEGVSHNGADHGTAIVMESQTGRILAMCNEPSFDPNSYNTVDSIDVFNNGAVFEAYEPGSVFKPLAMAIAIDQGVVTPATTYEDIGEVKIGDKVIRNFDKKPHGLRTMTQVLQESLNVGIIYATDQVNNHVFLDYVKKFGFGEPFGIEVAQESAGSLGSLPEAHDIYKATASFGQGITVTPLQMITAFNVIANNGVLLKPYIVEEVRNADGTKTLTKPKEVRRVISTETASTVAAMLVRVLEEGYDDKGSVTGYYLGGKTGTAQIAERGKYGNKTNHTFVGFGPVGNSAFTVLIKMHNVKNAGFAADSTTPIFHDIAEFLLNYYRIRPSK